ncbi:MAG: hypothetical protein IAX22_07085 [Candidatus Bathyarchaeota archaeon]|nr:hypothetical protein [Candidatus Bathyarchaeota archaeon]
MVRMGKYLSLLLILLVLSLTIISSTAKVWGPPDIHSSGGGGTDIVYISIQNGSEITNPVHLIVCVRTLLIPYCYSSVGEIGYSIDGDYIHNMVDVINQTIIYENGSDDATVWAHVTLPVLTETSHNVTVYFGRQHARYDVLAYKTVDFSIISPSPTLTPSLTVTPAPSLPNNGPTSPSNINSELTITLAWIIIGILVISVISLLLYVRHLKRSKSKN